MILTLSPKSCPYREVKIHVFKSLYNIGPLKIAKNFVIVEVFNGKDYKCPFLVHFELSQ